MFKFADFFIIELTLDCNAKCEYCYLLDRHEYKNIKMSFETYKSIIDNIIYEYQLKENKLPVNIVLHGGEPLLIGKELMDKMTTYSEKQLKKFNIKHNISIQTNGILLNEEFLSIFKKNNVSIGISFDGNKGSNKLRTPDPFVEEEIYNKIKKYSNEQHIGVLSVITKNNIDQIVEFEKLIGKKVKRIPVVDTRNKISNIEVPPKEFFDKLEKEYVESFQWLYFDTDYADLDRMLRRAVVDVLSDHSERCQSTCGFKFCGSGIRILSFEPNGAIHKCDRWDIEHKEKYFLHEPFTYDFLGIKQLKEAIKFNKILHDINKNSGCDLCYANYICLSQCQSLYYSKMGKFGINKNQICERTKLIYNFVSENIEKIIDIISEIGHFYSKEDDFYKLKNRIGFLMSEKRIFYNISKDNRTLYLKKVENERF